MRSVLGPSEQCPVCAEAAALTVVGLRTALHAPSKRRVRHHHDAGRRSAEAPTRRYSGAARGKLRDRGRRCASAQSLPSVFPLRAKAVSAVDFIRRNLRPCPKAVLKGLLKCALLWRPAIKGELGRRRAGRWGSRRPACRFGFKVYTSQDRLRWRDHQCD